MNLDITPDPVQQTPQELSQLLQWIRDGQANKFYWTYKWKIERGFVLREDKNECQHCKEKGRYRRATMVHHVKRLTKYPHLALCMWVQENGIWVRQLISLCDECHELEHPERLKQYRKKKHVTQERW